MIIVSGEIVLQNNLLWLQQIGSEGLYPLKFWRKWVDSRGLNRVGRQFYMQVYKTQGFVNKWWIFGLFASVIDLRHSQYYKFLSYCLVLWCLTSRDSIVVMNQGNFVTSARKLFETTVIPLIRQNLQESFHLSKFCNILMTALMLIQNLPKDKFFSLKELQDAKGSVLTFSAFSCL